MVLASVFGFAMAIVPAFVASVLWEPKNESEWWKWSWMEGFNDTKDREMWLIKVQLSASWRRELDGRKERERRSLQSHFMALQVEWCNRCSKKRGERWLVRGAECHKREEWGYKKGRKDVSKGGIVIQFMLSGTFISPPSFYFRYSGCYVPPALCHGTCST